MLTTALQATIASFDQDGSSITFVVPKVAAGGYTITLRKVRFEVV